MLTEEEIVIFRWRCDVCQKESEPLERDGSPPKGWFEHVIPWDYNKFQNFLKAHPDYQSATGMVGGSQRFHFCCDAHLEEWRAKEKVAPLDGTIYFRLVPELRPKEPDQG